MIFFIVAVVIIIYIYIHTHSMRVLFISIKFPSVARNLVNNNRIKRINKIWGVITIDVGLLHGGWVAG